MAEKSPARRPTGRGQIATDLRRSFGGQRVLAANGHDAGGCLSHHVHREGVAHHPNLVPSARRAEH